MIKNFRRNFCLFAAITAVAAPGFIRAKPSSLQISSKELQTAIVAATIDPNTGKSTVFFKDDYDTLEAMADKVSGMLQEKTDDSIEQQQDTHYRSIGLHLLSTGLAVFFILAALISHEPDNPYKI
jgi:hypothetical protein